MLIFQFKAPPPQKKPQDQLAVSNLSFNKKTWTLSMTIGNRNMAFNLWGLKQAAGQQTAGQNVSQTIGRFLRSVEHAAREYCKGDQGMFAKTMRYSVELFLKGQTTGQNAVRSGSILARELLRNSKAPDQVAQLVRNDGLSGLESFGTLLSPEFLKSIKEQVGKHYDQGFHKTGCRCGVKEGAVVDDTRMAAQIRQQLARKLVESPAVQEKLSFVTRSTETEIIKAVREQGTVGPMIARWEREEGRAKTGLAMAVPRITR